MLLTRESAVYKIFYWPFRFRIPYHNLIDYETFEKWGVRGCPEAAKEQALAMVDVLLTINQMAEYYREGASLQLVYLSDAEIIHQILVDHLTLWVEAFTESEWSYQPPLDDLRLLCGIGEELLSLERRPEQDAWGQMLLIYDPAPERANDSRLFSLLTTIEENFSSAHNEH